VAEAGAVVLNMDSDYASKGCTPSNRGLAGRACPALFPGAPLPGNAAIHVPVTPTPGLRVSASMTSPSNLPSRLNASWRVVC